MLLHELCDLSKSLKDSLGTHNHIPETQSSQMEEVEANPLTTFATPSGQLELEPKNSLDPTSPRVEVGIQ